MRSRGWVPPGCGGCSRRPNSIPENFPANELPPSSVQIACPNCHTRYALDDRLVPTGGAPVQCTRCGLVFTAQRGGEAPADRDTAGALRDAAVRERGAHRGPHPDRGVRPEPAAFGLDPGLRRRAPLPPRRHPGPGAGAGRTQVFGVGNPRGGAHAGLRRQAPLRSAAPGPPPSGGADPGLRRTACAWRSRGSPGHRPSRRARRSSVALPRPAPEPPPSMRTQVFGGAAAPGAEPRRLHRHRGRRGVRRRGGRVAQRRGARPPTDARGRVPRRRSCRRWISRGSGPSRCPARGVGADPSRRDRIRRSGPWPGSSGGGTSGPSGRCSGSSCSGPWRTRAGRGGAAAPRCRPRCRRTGTRPSPCSGRDDPQSRASALKVLDALVARYPPVGGRARHPGARPDARARRPARAPPP